jgi:hypothetical protein
MVTMNELATAPDSAVFEKWGEAARAGFQAVPDLLLKHQERRWSLRALVKWGANLHFPVNILPTFRPARSTTCHEPDKLQAH